MQPGVCVRCEDVATDGRTKTKPCHRTQDGKNALHGLKPEIRRDLSKEVLSDDATCTLGADDNGTSQPSGRIGLQEVRVAMPKHSLCNGVVFATHLAPEVIDRTDIDLVRKRRELSKDNHAIMENVDKRSLIATCKEDGSEG
jgi:hypothetical protein